MRFICFFLSALAGTGPMGIMAQECLCNNLANINFQPRGPAKNLVGTTAYVRESDTIQIPYVCSWQKTYQSETYHITWNPRKRTSQRKLNTPEDTLYILKGYIWLVKQVKFDCDYHIEIGPKERTGERIIVEVPVTNRALQLKLKMHLDSLSLPIPGCSKKKGRNGGHFEVGLPVIITGYGFYDAFHKVNTNHGDMHTKKYNWELHPVTNIIFL